MIETDLHSTVKEEAREAMQSGLDVHEKIKSITLKALTEKQLDMDNVRSVAESVTKGISEGLTAQGEHAGQQFGEAFSALDEALAKAAEASKLAIEEALSRVSEYSNQDIDSAARDMEDMEGLFLDTLEKAVKSGNQILSEVADDFLLHTRQSGTAVGKQVLVALEALKQLPQWGMSNAVSGTVAATITLAQIGSGILSGIAESLQQKSHPDK
jgi:hypothetical protein